MLQNRPWVKLRNLNTQFNYEQELQHALAELRVSPIKPPARGSAGEVVAKLEYIMNEKRDGGKMAEMVKEIIDLPVVKKAIMKMVENENPEIAEKALKMIPAMIAAMCKAASPRREEDDGKDMTLDKSDLV